MSEQDPTHKKSQVLYEALINLGMSKEKAARIAKDNDSSNKGGKQKK